jgi:hypothetical protein
MKGVRGRHALRLPAGTAGIREARHDKPHKGKSPGSANRRGIMKQDLQLNMASLPTAPTVGTDNPQAGIPACHILLWA